MTAVATPETGAERLERRETGANGYPRKHGRLHFLCVRPLAAKPVQWLRPMVFP